MIKKILFCLCISIVILLGVSFQNVAHAQQDLSSINVDDLTDAQVQQFVAQVQASGLPLSQLEQVAQARGMSPAQIAKLKARIDKAGVGEKANSTVKRTGRKDYIPERRNYTDTLKNRYGSGLDSLQNMQSLSDKALSLLKSKIFGADLFKNAQMSFEPNMRMATPASYQIGPDDEILIDIYGYSEASYTLTVSPEGKINIPYVGLVSVGNMSMSQASQRIKMALSKVYKAMSSGQTKADISLGNVRSVKVILTGELVRPGTYTLSSFATVMNALYAAGGPNENGSYRKILVIRGGRAIANVDIYDFLMSGELKNNVRLQDGDVIRVPPYINRVELIGQVKRSGIFEALKGETFADILQYAGGFNEYAYKARVKVLQNSDNERKIQDVMVNEYNEYHPMTGDKIYIDKILDRFANRVTISGAVFRPGAYSLDENKSLKVLLQHAEGVKEEAYLDRGYILRLKNNSESELVSFNLKSVLDGAEDVTLQREDSVQIKSIYDLREDFIVKVKGQVREPGEFKYAEGMTLKDIILKSGGFKDNASTKRIEISRRLRKNDTSTNEVAKVFQVDLNKSLQSTENLFELEPFDIVTIRPATGYEIQRQVLLEGEVKFPGYYTITRKDERISDLIQRAGGLTQWAYAEGASLKRLGAGETNQDTTLLGREKERIKLEQFKKLQFDANDTAKINLNAESVRNNFVGIDLKIILKKPGRRLDLYLQDGDVINIPVRYQTVTVSGEVLSPSKVVFSNGRSLKGYINSAGGFSYKAAKGKVYVNYANGGVLGTRGFLFFRSYPRLKPGAEIFVPKREAREKLGIGQIAGISSAFASIAAILITVLRK